jgi:hypothetical protein
MTDSDNAHSLGRLDAKVTALLAMAVDARQRAVGVKTKPRSIDQILFDAGLTAKEIGSLLGKTDRAVNLVLQAGRARDGGAAKEDL